MLKTQGAKMLKTQGASCIIGLPNDNLTHPTCTIFNRLPPNLV